MQDGHTYDTMENRAPRVAKREQEVEDIGRVLAHLLGETQNASEIVKKYLTQDLKKFKSINSKKISGLDKLPELLVDGGAHIDIGGSAVVLQVTNEKVTTVKYALKIPRPSLYKSLEAAHIAHHLSEKEFFHHAPLVHENIARLYGIGSMLITPDLGAPYMTQPILLEWIQNAKPLNSYLLKTELDYKDMVRLFIQCFVALDHLHTNKLIHWDIESDNFLISSDGIAKLTDIGNARSLQDDKRGLEALSTYDSLPPSLRAKVPAPTGSDYSSRRVRLTLPDDSWDCFWLDMWMLSRDLNELFGANDAWAARSRSSSVHWRYSQRHPSG